MDMSKIDIKMGQSQVGTPHLALRIGYSFKKCIEIVGGIPLHEKDGDLVVDIEHSINSWRLSEITIKAIMPWPHWMTGGIINETSLFTSDLQKLKEYTVFKIISLSWKLQSATSTAVHTPGERAQWNGAGAKQTRPRVVPHFSSGIVERGKCKRLWKSPHTRKGDARWGERKMRDYRQSPSFWTYALLSQHKTLIGSSTEICQHLWKTRQPLSTLNIITIYRTNK